MNLVQVFVALALFFISSILASDQFQIDSSLSGASFPVGGAITFTVTATNLATAPNYNATFVDQYQNIVVLAPTSPSLNSITFIPSPQLYGTVTLTAVSTDESIALSSLPVSFTVYSSLTVTSPSSSSVITYGQPINLAVTTNGPAPVSYTASFTCPTGSYQITGLITGISYDLVLAGLYGQIVATVTAESNSPGTIAFTIFKPSGNIPPAFIPAQLPYYPSVYAKMNDGKVLEIVSVEYSRKPPM